MMVYRKAAGISLLIHIVLLCIAAFVAGQVPSTRCDPPPVEIEIEPSRLMDMGSGKLHFASGSPPPGPRKAGPRMRIAAAKPAPSKPVSSQPGPPSAPASTDHFSPPLPGEINDTSVALPLPGDKETAGGDSGYGPGGTFGGGGGKGAGGQGGGSGSSAGDGEGDGGGYAGSGCRYGKLPNYPRAARKTGREGIVTIRVLVGTDGNPASVAVRETSGYEDFDNAAAQAVRKWRFFPAKKRGEPVASFHDVKVRFRLSKTGR